MGFTELRRSERIRNRNNPMLRRREKRQRSLSQFSTRARPRTTFNGTNNKHHHSTNFLSRLPPKSFFHCRIICKTWFSLRGFFYNTLWYGHVGFVNLSCGINKMEVDGTMSALSCHNQYLEILDCCNGILLVETSNKKSPFEYDINVHI